MRFVRFSVSFSLALALSQPAYAQQPDTVPGIGAIAREMPIDLWRYLSLDTAIVLGGGGAAAGIAHIWDDDLKQEVETSVRLNDALQPGNTYGSFPVQVVVGVGMYTVGRLFDSSPLGVAGADIMRAQFVSQMWVQVLKFSTQRTRPDGSNDLSFPSGHSASSFATAAVLQRHFGWKVGIPAFVVAGYVATARVHDNRHYLSDVVFGAAMGIAGERTVMRSGRYTVRVAPAAGPKRASLMFVVSPGA
jgi:PAP2 superfamily